MSEVNYETAWNALKDNLNEEVERMLRIRVAQFDDTSFDGLVLFFKTSFEDAIVQRTLNAMNSMEKEMTTVGEDDDQQTQD